MRFFTGMIPFLAAALSSQAMPIRHALPEQLKAIPSSGFTWIISYGPIHLGELRLSPPLYTEGLTLKLEVRSSKGLPMDMLEAEYRTGFTMPEMKPHWASGNSKWGRDTTITRYEFDETQNAVFYRGVSSKGGRVEERVCSIHPSDGALDLLSLIFHLMARCSENGLERLLLLSSGSTMPIDLEYRSRLATVRGPEGPETAWVVDGRTQGKGIAGLTGSFRVWIRTDGSRVPIRAELHALIGVVTICLARQEPPR